MTREIRIERGSTPYAESATVYSKAFPEMPVLRLLPDRGAVPISGAVQRSAAISGERAVRRGGKPNRWLGRTGETVYETGLLTEKGGQTAYIRQSDSKGKTIRLRRLSETPSIRSVSPPLVEEDTLYLCADTEDGMSCLLTFTAADLQLKDRISLDQTGGRVSSVDGDRAALLYPAAPYIALVDLESAQTRPITPGPAVSPARAGGAGTDFVRQIEKAVLAEERLYLCGTMTADNGIEGSTTGYVTCLSADGSLQWQDKYTDYPI